MTRILHILDHSLPIHSGYTFRTRAILKAQRAAGMEVRGITGPLYHEGETGTAEHDGLTFDRVPGPVSGPPGIREWRAISTLRQGVERVIADWQPDILHAHSPALCGMAGLRAARAAGLPFVYEIRAFWEDAAVGNLTGREGSVKYRLTRAIENRVVAARMRFSRSAKGCAAIWSRAGTMRARSPCRPMASTSPCSANRPRATSRWPANSIWAKRRSSASSAASTITKGWTF